MSLTQADIDAAVKTLLQLKADYKTATGADWKPGNQATPAAAKAEKPKPQSVPAAGKPESQLAEELKGKIEAQGNKVRDLKTGNAAKVRAGLLVHEFPSLVCIEIKCTIYSKCCSHM